MGGLWLSIQPGAAPGVTSFSQARKTDKQEPPRRNKDAGKDAIVPFQDLEAYQRVVDAHYHSLYIFALSLSKSEADAWDLTHDTFAIWAERQNSIRDKSKEKSWLYTTLYRCFLNRHRRRSREAVLQEEEHEAAEDVSAGRELDRQAAVRALQGLPEKFRGPLSLYYLEDYSCREIAEILGIRLGTVLSRLSRAREMLADRLASPQRKGI